MPQGFSFSEEAIATGNQLDPAWRKVFVSSVTVKDSEKEQKGGAPGEKATTWTVNLVVCEGQDGAKTPITVWFSSNFMNPALNYVKAFIPAGEKIEAGKDYPIMATSGQYVMAMCQWDSKQETPKNVVKDWRPVPVV